jgi:hypothetical protein
LPWPARSASCCADASPRRFRDRLPDPGRARCAILGFLDLAGIAVFALTGALLAARLRQTFVTMAFFALVTGVGSGSVRDLLIGAPVFWVRDPSVAPVCFVVALVAWFTRTVGGKGARWNGRMPPAWRLCRARHRQGAGLWRLARAGDDDGRYHRLRGRDHP